MKKISRRGTLHGAGVIGAAALGGHIEAVETPEKRAIFDLWPAVNAET